jgi:hypothetical protein
MATMATIELKVVLLSGEVGLQEKPCKNSDPRLPDCI